MAPKRSKSKGQPKQTQPPSEESKSSSYEPPEARMIGNIAPNEDNIFDEEEEDETPFAERVRLSLIEQKAELEAAERKEKARIKQQQRIANETRIAQEARENNQFAPEVITEIIPAMQVTSSQVAVKEPWSQFNQILGESRPQEQSANIACINVFATGCACNQ